jgi:hypothetical protein
VHFSELTSIGVEFKGLWGTAALGGGFFDDPVRPSACILQPGTHPGVDVLLQTIENEFDRTVTERSKPFFLFLGGRIGINFSPFSSF